MIIYIKILCESGETIFSLNNINENNFKRIPKHIMDLGYEVSEYFLNKPELDLPSVFEKNGFAFRYCPDDFSGQYFCSPNRIIESFEYYEELESVVKDIVALLNTDKKLRLD